MKVRDSGMPDQAYWESLFDVTLILDKLEINEQIDSLVEFGAGYGTFTSPTAERIQSKVISFDIDDRMIEIATNRTVSHKSKVSIIKRDFIADGTGLDGNSADYVMLFNILHHINPLEILDETYRILKMGGKAGIIHWNYDPTTPRGPHLNIRPKPEQIKEWAIKSGFKLKTDALIDLPPYHYGFLIYKY